ncbi:MAG: UbiA family prenyltransferase, partial [Bacteroidota bacterium]
MFSKLAKYCILLRITSWAKNFFVFVPLIFAKQLFNRTDFFEVVLGFILFSAAASSIYVVNDIVDAKRDSIHPLKRNRPVASGKVTVKEAKFIALLLFASTILISFTVNLSFVAIV